jgi:hypothetical protein
MSFIGHWLADDIVREGMKTASTTICEYTRSLPPATQKFAPVLYTLVGAKALQISVDTAKKGKEAIDAVTTNLKLVGCKTQSMLYRSVFMLAMTMDKMDIKLKIVTPEEFEKIRTSTEFFNDKSEVVIDFLPLEFCVTSTALPSTIKLIYGSGRGVYSAKLHCSPQQYKSREVEIAISPNKNTPLTWIKLKF